MCRRPIYISKRSIICSKILWRRLNCLSACFFSQFDCSDSLFGYQDSYSSLRPIIHLSRNMRKWAGNAKNKMCISRYFAPLFSHFTSHFSVFTFCSISCQSRHSHKKSKDFAVYFFAALIKHEIRMKCEKCLVSVSYFMVCFTKNIQDIQKVYSQSNGKQKLREVETYCTWLYFSVHRQWKYVRVHLSVEYNNESATQYACTLSYFISGIIALNCY